MDKLQDYLIKNATNLGNDMPSKNVWVGINAKNEIQQSKVVTANRKTQKSIIVLFAKYAVAACVIALAGYGGWSLLQPKITNNNFVNIKPKNNINIDTEYVAPKTADTPMAVIQNVANKIITVLSSNKETVTQKNNELIVEDIATNSVGFLQVKNVDSQFQQIINIQKNKINNTPLFAEKPAFFKEFLVSFKQMEQDERNVKKDIVALGFTDHLLDQLINVNQQKLNLLKLLQTEINKTNIRFKQNRYLIDTAKAYFIKI